jgi:hypothetical protein
VPLLTWSADLAKQAQQKADGCGRGGDDNEARESLAWGYQSFAAVVRAWYGEVSMQMVWHVFRNGVEISLQNLWLLLIIKDYPN